jgi:hypothetical protein
LKCYTTSTVSYEDVFPSNFHVGDIVSIEAVLYAFQNEQKRIRLHINLRAMTLIESKFSKVRNPTDRRAMTGWVVKDAEEAQIKANTILRVTGNKLRRSIPFEKRKRDVRSKHHSSSSGTGERE